MSNSCDFPLREKRIDISGDTGIAADQLAEGFGRIAGSGLTAEEGLLVLEQAAQASALGMGDTKEFSFMKTQQGSNVLTCGHLVSNSCDFTLREKRLATITDLLSDSLAAYADSAANAGEYNDVLMTTAQQTGLSMADLQSGLGSVLPAAAKMGVGIEQVTDSLRCA